MALISASKSRAISFPCFRALRSTIWPRSLSFSLVEFTFLSYVGSKSNILLSYILLSSDSLKMGRFGFSLSASMKKTSSLSTTTSRLRSVAVLLLFCFFRCTLWRLCSRSKHFKWYLASSACMFPSESFPRRTLSWRVTAYSRTVLSMETVRALIKVSLVSSPLPRKTTLRLFKTLTRHLASFYWTFVVFFTTLTFFDCPQCSLHFLIINFRHELNKACTGSQGI